MSKLSREDELLSLLEVCAESCPENRCNTYQMAEDSRPLTYWNVAVAAAFLVASSILSLILGLQLEKSILIAGIRCFIQLTIMGFILRDVFEARNPWLVLAMTLTLTLLGTFEVNHLQFQRVSIDPQAVYNKAKKRFDGMFAIVLTSMLSIFIISVLGSKFALKKTHDFWEPSTLIPIIGMLIGNAISGISVGLGFVLDQITVNTDKIELYLAFGATRWEAAAPVLVEAVRLALLPTINQMRY